jgi:glycine/D-amino acid oxidase-like deaminating enzyme
MSRIFEDRAYDADSLSGCFWAEDFAGDTHSWGALEGSQKADVAIIGAGYTGLSAALHLAKAGVDVAVLDMHEPGWGASGRSGGFCCMGGAMLKSRGIRRHFGGAAETEWDAVQKDAVHLVADLIQENGIDAQTHSNGETQLAHNPRSYRRLARDAEALAKSGEAVEFIETAALADNGMTANGLLGGMTEPVGFALHPRRYVLGLAKAVTRAGGRVYANACVDKIVPKGAGYSLETATGQLCAKRVIFATNGYSRDDAPSWLRGRFMPVQSNILVTRILTDDEIQAQGWTTLQMVYDTRRLLHYFRLLPDNRMMFGMRGGISATPAMDQKMHRMIRQDFEAMFPAWRHVETPWFWTGLVCLTGKRVPYVGVVPDMPGAFAGFGWHGNGIAMGTYAGRMLADLARGQDIQIPNVMRGAPIKIPFGKHRRVLLPPIYKALSIRDWLD